MTDDSTLGHVDLLKVYFEGVNPKLPTGGKMSMKIGSVRQPMSMDQLVNLFRKGGGAAW